MNAVLPYLVIFDNVEDSQTLSSIWPTSSTGSVKGSNKKIVARSPVQNTLEVPTFTADEGAEMIFRILQKDQVSDDERLAATQVSKSLGGLALAIGITGRRIKTEKELTTVRAYLDHEANNASSLHLRLKEKSDVDPFYSKNIAAVWQRTFEILSPDSARLMSLLTFFAPDGIPVRLLEGKQTSHVDWEFICNPQRYHTHDFLGKSS